MKIRALVLFVLASGITAFAGPPDATALAGASVASLNGTYAVTSQKSTYVSWSVLVSCPHYSGWLYAGSDLATEISDGTSVADGKGDFSYSGKKYGVFDQNLSNQTATWYCDSNGDPYISNSGYAVYDPPSSESITGTYSVQSDYTGTMYVSGQAVLHLRLSGVTYFGLATSFMMHDITKDNSGGSTGFGIIQQCGRFCTP